MKKVRSAIIVGETAGQSLFLGTPFLGYTQSAGDFLRSNWKKRAELARNWIHEGVTLHLRVVRLVFPRDCKRRRSCQHSAGL